MIPCQFVRSIWDRLVLTGAIINQSVIFRILIRSTTRQLPIAVELLSNYVQKLKDFQSVEGSYFVSFPLNLRL
jgi:hypothetical protein